MSWSFNILLRWVIIVPRVFWYCHCHFATLTRKRSAEWFRMIRITWIVSNIAIRIMFHSYFHNELYNNFNDEHLPLHKHDKPQIKQSHLSLVCYHNHIQSRLNWAKNHIDIKWHIYVPINVHAPDKLGNATAFRNQFFARFVFHGPTLTSWTEDNGIIYRLDKPFELWDVEIGEELSN